MSGILSREGGAGLWTGVGARVARVGPSCAIMVSTYEVVKRAYAARAAGGAGAEAGVE